MLAKTYQKVIRLFTQNHGYMSFEQLRENDITVLQMRELEEEGVLQRFTRGWYWCTKCGFQKPVDYKYIEISKMNPDAIICLDSACYLCGLNVKEPEAVKVATARDDRKKMEIDFPIKRYYLTHIEIGKYIQLKRTEFGNYRYFSAERALFDCASAPKKVDAENVEAIKNECNRHADKVNRYRNYIRRIKRQEKEERRAGE